MTVARLCVFSWHRTVNCEMVKKVNGVWVGVCVHTGSMCLPLCGRHKGILLPIKGRTHSRFILGTFEEMGHLDFDLSPQVG